MPPKTDEPRKLGTSSHHIHVAPDDVVALVILLGCFLLVGMGRDDKGVLTHILEITIGVILGRRTKSNQHK